MLTYQTTTIDLPWSRDIVLSFPDLSKLMRSEMLPEDSKLMVVKAGGYSTFVPVFREKLMAHDACADRQEQMAAWDGETWFVYVRVKTAEEIMGGEEETAESRAAMVAAAKETKSE